MNVALAFVAGFMATFGAFIAATPKNPGTAALIAAGAAAVWAGIRAAIGLIASATDNTITVDK